MRKDYDLRIGIITLSASDNCGSLLQTYALQTVLQNMGKFDVEVINFSTPESHDIYDIFNKRCLWDLKRLKYRVKYYKSFRKQKKDYMYFRKNFLKFSQRREIFPKKMNKICCNYDLVITGSDQIWNVKMNDFNNAFFAYWTDCKKVAYAPSLGGHDIREADHYEQIVEWLKAFDAISVRERMGKRCLEELLGKKIEVVLDPTLIVDKKVWNDITGSPRINEKYIFYYSWSYKNDELNKIVQREAERTGHQVYVIDESKWTRKNYKKYGFKLSDRGGPLAFLNLMKYAEKCFVESFHGMIFAYIFEKDFWILDEELDGKYDERISDLAFTLQMENRFLTPTNCDAIDNDRKPDYATSYPCLFRMQEISQNYLKINLK